MVEAGNIGRDNALPFSLAARDIVMEGAFFFFFPNSARPASNWIPRRFGVQLRGKLNSDDIASLQSAKWETIHGAPKEAILLPSYAAFDFGRGVTVTVNRESVEIEQERESGDAVDTATTKDRVLPLAEQLITLLDLRSVRSFVTQLRMIVPHPHPLDLLAERYLRPSALKKTSHPPSTVRLTLGYPIKDGEFRVALIPYGPTAAWKEPHLSVRAEFIFGYLARKRLLELIAHPEDYENEGQAILVALLK